MKDSLRKLLLFMICCCLTAVAAEARHIKGGWMFYRYLGQTSTGLHQYRVTLKVYRDCSPPNMGQNDTQIFLTVYNNTTGNKHSDNSAPLTGTYTLSKTSYSECVNPKPEVCYVILEYETTIDLPATERGYTISFQRCCRINGIVNVLQPSDNLGNTYSITVPGNGVRDQYPVNSSPVFSQRDTLLVCYNSPIQLDYSATDPDGDSLVYYFTDALNGASQNNPSPTTSPPPPYSSLPYGNSFSAGNPFGTNMVINKNTGVISGISPGITGEYVVSVGIDEFRNGNRIATTRKELHVNVANCSIVAAKLPIKITSCNSYDVQFENLSSSPAILNYFWDFGVNNIRSDTSIEAMPKYTYPDTGVFTAKLIVNKGSSCSDSSTAEVRVFPGFKPGIKADGSCFSNPFQFTDTTKSPFGLINYWRWDFGNPTATNDTSLLRNPVYNYPGIGSYRVKLEVGNNKGCLDTTTITVSVTDRPSYTLTRDTLICSIDTLQMNARGTGTFTWDPHPTLINANAPNALVFPKDTTKYYVTLRENGCVARDSVTVNVLEFITVDAGRDSTICLSDGFAMRPVSQALSYSWSPPLLFDNPTAKQPVFTPVAPVTKVLVTANLGKCQDRDSLLVKAVPYPTAEAGADSTICFGDTALLKGSASGSIYAWSPARFLTRPDSLITAARNLTGNVMFTLTVRDTLGCPKPVLDSVLITLRPRITVFAGNDTAVVLGQTLRLNAVSNASLVQWQPSLGLNNSNILNPTALFTAGTLPAGQDRVLYKVSVSTPEGCRSSDDILVRVFKTAPSIFVPNAFTPNGDGLNDIIRPILAGMEKLLFFRIYNRYGQLVYETSQSGAGWDGTIRGAPQPSNAYVYQCQGIDFQGNTITEKGTFVLVR